MYPRRNILLFFAFIIASFLYNSSIKAQNVLFCGDTTVASGSSFSYHVSYSNYKNIIGFQFDLIIPEEITFLGYKTTPLRYTDHQVIVSKINDKKIRVLCFSASNSLIKNTSEVLVIFDLRSGTQQGKYKIEISNALLVDPAGKNILDSVTNGSITISDLSHADQSYSSPYQKNESDDLRIYPNPFNNSAAYTYFAFSLVPVKLELINIQGRRIYEETLFPSSAGWNSGIINMMDYPSGLYFTRIVQKEKSSVKKIMLLK